MEGPARRLRDYEPGRLKALQRLVGLREPGAPIRVLLASEDSEAARSVPAWVTGYAYGTLGVMVLLPERAPTYPDSSLEEVFRHELAHVLVARAAAGKPVPRWFNEGLAMVAAGTWGLEDRSRLTFALLVEDRVPLGELDRRFAGDIGDVHRAYALSGAFVRDMLRHYGNGAAAGILRRLSLGQSFELAFHRTTGRDLSAAEEAFWKRQSIWYRWVPILTSSFTLWLGITLLALVAARRRRLKTAELKRRWDEEERVLSERPEEPPLN